MERYCPQCETTYVNESKCAECGGALIERDRAMHQKLTQLSHKLGKASRPNQAYGEVGEDRRREIFLRGLQRRAAKNKNDQKARRLQKRIDRI